MTHYTKANKHFESLLSRLTEPLCVHIRFNFVFPVRIISWSKIQYDFRWYSSRFSSVWSPFQKLIRRRSTLILRLTAGDCTTTMLVDLLPSPLDHSSAHNQGLLSPDVNLSVKEWYKRSNTFSGIWPKVCHRSRGNRHRNLPSRMRAEHVTYIIIPF